MPKVVTNPISAFTQGAIATLSQNFDRIEAAIENTLSRDGTTPNQMTADLDLNSNDILNVKNLDAETLRVNGSPINLVSIVDDVEVLADDIKQRDLGAFADAATADAYAASNGITKIVGTTYFNTTDSAEYRWTGSVWVAANSSIDRLFRASDKAALAALSPAPDLAAAFDGDLWIDKTYADYAAAAAADTFGAQYLRSTFDTSRVRARAGETISAKTFGYEPYQGQNAFSAFTNAIEFLNALPHGATLTVPSGRCTIDGALPPITASNIFLWFEKGSSVLHDGDWLFEWGGGVSNSVVDGGVFNMAYVGATVPATGTGLVKMNGVNRLSLAGLRGTNVNKLLDTADGIEAGGFFIDDCRISVVNTDEDFIRARLGANAQIRGLDATVRNYSVAYPQGVQRVLDSGASATLTGALKRGIVFGDDRWDTFIFQGVLLNGFRKGLVIDRVKPNTNVSNGKVTDFYADYCGEHGILLKNSATGGGINNIEFKGGWTAAMDGHGVELAGAVGSHRDITFLNVKSLTAGKNSWRLASSTMESVRLINCEGFAANRFYTTNVGSDQDCFVALYGGWSIDGGVFNRDPASIIGTQWQGRYGINVAPDLTDYVIQGNPLVEGVVGDTNINLSLNTTSSGSLSRRVGSMRRLGGAARPSYATTGTMTLPASGTTNTNLSPLSIEYQVYGPFTSLVKNGTQIASGAPETAGRTTLTFFVDLTNIAAAGNVITGYLPGYAFQIEGVDFIVAKPVTTPSKRVDFNIKIGAVDVTGGVVSVTSAAATPMGSVIAGTPVAGANSGAVTDTMSIVASSVTPHTEGNGWLVVKIRNFDTYNSIFSKPVTFEILPGDTWSLTYGIFVPTIKRHVRP
jgi:hypothetical protein